MNPIKLKAILHTIIWIVIFLWFGNCTGINVYQSFYGTEGITNPTPQYANPSIVLRGGGVIHRNAIAGAIGKDTPGELLKGEACSWSILYLVAGGNSSLSKAKENGGMDFIHFSEFKQEAIFGFIYHSFCTVVVGTKAL